MINSLSIKIPIRFLCRYFSVSSSRFYQWLKGQVSGRAKSKKEICKAIKKSFKRSKKTYGSPRVFDDLIEWGFKISENTVAKYMKELGLDARHKKKFKVVTTDSNHRHPIAPRLFKTECKETLPTKPGSPWENGYCESFNGKMRYEFLNSEIFHSLFEARRSPHLTVRS